MIDLLHIDVAAGTGGDGIVSFRREKNIPNGGPNGGNGGKGGSVYLIGNQHMTTLAPFQRQHRFLAENGGRGGPNNRHGKNGEDARVEVPLGTQAWITTPKGDTFLGDLTADRQELLVARGTRGGRGNLSFVSSTQQAPYIAEKGTEGEKHKLRLELKLLADVGIVGKPNAGKSTLLSVATAAKPKIAPYPFTTLEPIVGVVGKGENPFVLAEIPGLIAGASEGTGLGLEFLRHATRTRLLIHLVDGSDPDISQCVRDLDAELAAYSESLSTLPETPGGTAIPRLDTKPQVLVINKLDMPEVEERQQAIAKELSWTMRPVRFISAAGNVGVAELMQETAELLTNLKQDELETAEATAGAPQLASTIALQPRHRDPVVHKDGDVYVVEDDRAIRFVGGSNLRFWPGRVQLKLRLDRLGVTKELVKAGIQPGDFVRFGPTELEWTG